MSWDTVWMPDEPTAPKNPQDAYMKIYPVFLRKRLLNSEVKYSETLMYVASKEHLAKEWCERNLDIEIKDDPEHCWWFAITQEAVDGEYIGVKGLVCLLDWDGKEINYQPVDGYKKKEEKDAN